jgi:RNA-directed DNA polymerase
MERVRARIADNRVLALVKAFLKAGILTEDGALRDTDAGTPQGGLCSAEHNPPYAQRRVMRSAGLPGLVDAGSASGHCA